MAQTIIFFFLTWDQRWAGKDITLQAQFIPGGSTPHTFWFIQWDCYLLGYSASKGWQWELSQYLLGHWAEKSQCQFLLFLPLKHTANLSWQTRVGKFKKLANSFLHTSNSRQITNTVICNMADLFSAVALTQNSETGKRREQTEIGGELERFQRNPVCPLAPPFSFLCFFSKFCNLLI